MKNTIILVLFPFFLFGQTQIGDDIDGENAGDYFGYNLSISNDGNIIAVGAFNNDDGGDYSGHTRIYKKENNTWEQIGDDINGEAAFDISGRSVSLSGNGSFVAIGANLNDGNGDASGHVRIYENINEAWVQVGEDIDGVGDLDYLGEGVSMSNNGNIVAVGAVANNNNGIDSGQVRVFQNIQNNWQQIGQDINGEASNDQIGGHICLSSEGNILAIGSPFNDSNGQNSGHVRVFTLIDNMWVQVGEAIHGDYPFDYLGYSPSLSDNGEILAIGVVEGNGSTEDSGQVKIYKNIDNNWIQIGNSINGQSINENFGASVSLSGNGEILAVGAPFYKINGIETGQSRIYQYINNNWIQIGDDINGEDEYDIFGYNLGISNSGATVVIGAFENDGNGQNSGHVRVYDLSQILSLNEQLINNNFTIYPNPASKKITIKLLENQEVRFVNIYNNLGQLVQTETKTSFDISSFTAGSYYVRVTTDRGVSTQKLLVE